MGIYSRKITAARAIPGNNVAIDFTDVDSVSGELINNGSNENSTDATLSGTYAEIARGIEFSDGHAILNNEADGATFTPKTAVFQFRRTASSSGAIIDVGTGTDFADRSLYILCTSSGEIRAVDFYGTIESSNTTVPLDTDVIVAVVLNGSASKLIYGTPGDLTTQTFDGLSYQQTDMVTKFGLTRQGTLPLVGEIHYAMVFSSVLTESQINSIFDAPLTDSQLLFSTNLPAERYQTFIVLDDARELVYHGSVLAGESELTADIELIGTDEFEFFAFDTDASLTVLTTGPLVPAEETPLNFDPVSGGGGGDPGTGLLAHIAGTVSIDGTGSEREVIVISDDPAGRQVLGEGMSASDGTFDIEYADWGGAVIALALDDYGNEWTAETVLASGTIIHPTLPNGYVYAVTSGGTTGTEEPTWSINSPVNDGSVTYNPRPFYRPIASGPLQGEVTQEADPEELPITLLAMIESQQALVSGDLTASDDATVNYSNFVADVDPVPLDDAGIYVYQVSIDTGLVVHIGATTTEWTDDGVYLGHGGESIALQSIGYFPSNGATWWQTLKGQGGAAGTEPVVGDVVTVVFDMSTNSMHVYQGDTLLCEAINFFNDTSEESFRPAITIRSDNTLTMIFDPESFTDLPSDLDTTFEGWERWTGRFV